MWYVIAFLAGCIFTVAMIRFIIGCYERCQLRSKARKNQSMSEHAYYYAQCLNRQKRERLTDAEVARIVSVRDHPKRNIVYRLPNSQLRRMIKKLRGEPKDYLELERIRRELRSEGD